METDSRFRFLIESCDVRGQLIHLDRCWTDAKARVDYPPTVATLLGEAFAAAALMAGTIKFDGKLTLQVRGSGDVHLLVVQITNDGNMRGLARWHDVPESTEPAACFGADARITISIETDQMSEPYQGIVPLQGDSLAEAIGHYFNASEQLQTKVYFAVSDSAVSGMLLQALPASEQTADDDDAWARATALADTLSDEEMLDESAETLLYRLYHEEQVRLFESSTLSFSCSCSRERTDGLLAGLGEKEVLDIVNEQGEVSIDCEFCDANYRYDAVDVAALFKGYVASSENDTDTRH